MSVAWAMTEPRDAEFTERQEEVLRLVGGEGLTYQQAAGVLGVEYTTVRKHAQQIRDRAGLSMSPYRAMVHLWYQQRAS